MESKVKKTPNKNIAKSSRGGGSATFGGVSYQSRVAGWAAVRILAEQNASPIWDLSQASLLQTIRLETDQAVDDLLITASKNEVVYIQAKHGLNFSKREDSEFASCFEQFTR